MKGIADSMYGRLALVLLCALTIAFGTAFMLFRQHSNDSRLAAFSHSVAIQLQLAETMLAHDPRIALQPPPAVHWFAAPPTTQSTIDQSAWFGYFTQLLNQELGARKPTPEEVVATEQGIWIRLRSPAPAAQWMAVPLPQLRRGIETWMWWGLGAGFFATLVGGMLLLWGVNRPLRTLEHAFAAVGFRAAEPLAIQGPREIRHLTEQFNLMLARLQQYDQDRNEMISGVAHDLRAPLTRLRLRLELAGLDAETHEGIARNLDGIDAIVSQFLAFSQGAMVEPFVRLQLSEFLMEWARPYRELGVAVTAPPALTVDIMPVLLARALTNLVENAIEYGQPPIAVTARMETEAVVLSVADAGPGIPAAQRARALQPFVRLEQARAGAGHSGLGLAIAARIARLHGGALHLEAVSPTGLSAAIRLPRQLASRD